MITVGSRVRWNGGRTGAEGIIGYEGTVVALSPSKDRRHRWAWVEYDDGTEQDAYLCNLKEISDDENN